MGLPANIILIGFMGSGKTSTGKELSHILGFQFLDMDQLIEEKSDKKIKTIFEENGEVFFRNLEKEVIGQLRSKKNFVISSGGGAWIDQENREVLLQLGWCVWLKVSAEKAWKRVSPHSLQRPLLAGQNVSLKKLEEMLNTRNPVYSLAHRSFDTDEKSPKEIALEILKILKEEQPFDLSALPE
jgi:shikimate kinase